MTGLIPRPFIDELLNRIDIIELIDSYVPLKKRGNNHIACCPFHNEKTPSFNVTAKKQFYHCFGCGESGNAISFVMKYLNQEFVEAIETLAARIGMHIPGEGRSQAIQQTPGLYEFMQNIASHYQEILYHSGKEALTYLQRRQVSELIAKKFLLGYAPDKWHHLEQTFHTRRKDLITTGMSIQKDDGRTYDRYRHRLIFPIHDRRGRIIGFGGRTLDEHQKPKYLNSPETIIFQKNRELYGLYQLLQQEKNPHTIIVVEGYMDVIALAEHDIPNAVATLGTATSVYHIQLLSKYCKRVVFCFDGDSAGRKAAWKALESTLPHMDTGVEVGFSFIEEDHDPDSLVRCIGRQSFLQRIDEALNIETFFIQSLTKDIDTSTLAGKTQLINAAKPYLQCMPEGAFKQLLLDNLSRRARIETHRFQQILLDKSTVTEASPIMTVTRTPIRVAIAILLQHPEIYQQCQQYLSHLDLDEQNLTIIKTLLESIAKNPNIHTAMLVESWRMSPLFDAISKLAAWDHQVPEHALVTEFVDTVLFLAKKHREKKIQELLEKSRNQGLTESERLQLQEMLRQRHFMVQPENINSG